MPELQPPATPVGQQPPATTSPQTPAATPPTPEVVKYRVSERSEYDIPKDYKPFNEKGEFVPPPSLDKAHRELLKSNSELRSKLQERDRTQEILNSLEQVVTKANPPEPDDPKPDRFAEPDKYDEWILRQAGNQAAQKAKEAAELAKNQINAVDLAVKLTKGETPETSKENLEKLWDYMHANSFYRVLKTDKNGEALEVDINPRHVEIAFKAMNYDDAIKAAEARGEERIKQTLKDANGAPLSIPGQVPSTSTGTYDPRNMTEAQRFEYRRQLSARNIPTPT